HLRMLGDRSCDGKSLLLSAGYVGTALSDMALIPVRLFLYEFHGLSDLRRLFHLFFASVRIAEHDIRSNVTGEKQSLLRHISETVSQLMLADFPDICS